MAKVFVASFLAAVVIVATHGIPVPSAVGAKVHEIQISSLNDNEKQVEPNAIHNAPKETDWTAVSAKIQEIQVSVINAGFDQIKTVAFNDNPTIPIANEVDNIARNIRESIGQMKFQATIQRLTKTLVYYYLSSVRWELVDLINTLSQPEFLPQLSEEAVEEINSLFTTINSGLDKKQGELYDIVPAVIKRV